MVNRAVILGAFAPTLVSGHGALVIPRSRNAVDGDVSPWNKPIPVGPHGGVPTTGEPYCPMPDASAPNTKAGRISAANAQACFWFSNGCSTGCLCDGVSRGPIPNVPCKDPNPNSTEPCARKRDVCGAGPAPITIPREARTVNTGAIEGAVDDYYQYSPWRAPGSAVVRDPCGMAGGGLAPAPHFGISYQNTSHAQFGSRGSALPTLPAGPAGGKKPAAAAQWTAGDVVEVSWSLTANHGGGYYYRLCKVPEDGAPPTEKCFQQTPLRFVGRTALRWDGDDASKEYINNVFVEQGTTPAGSQWAMNPIPRNDSAQTGASFAPLCNETCTGCSAGGGCPDCRCTGEWGVPNLEIVDNVALPWALPEGDYLLGWRWDCEESNQVWQNCADVHIKAAPMAPDERRLVDDDDTAIPARAE